MNHWGEHDKAAHLANNLRGLATGVLASLSQEQSEDCPSLITALEIQFGDKHLSSTECVCGTEGVTVLLS